MRASNVVRESQGRALVVVTTQLQLQNSKAMSRDRRQIGGGEDRPVPETKGSHCIVGRIERSRGRREEFR